MYKEMQVFKNREISWEREVIIHLICNWKVELFESNSGDPYLWATNIKTGWIINGAINTINLTEPQVYALIRDRTQHFTFEGIN